MGAAHQRPTSGYSVKLEALRGLAALMVVGHHVFPSNIYPWMHVLFNGSAAVSLFFVLSGYVLGLSLRRGNGTLLWQYLSFQFRRVLRIYPAYFVTTLAFVAYWKLYPFAGGQGHPLAHLANLKLTTLQLVKNFVFLDQSINAVTWSLKVEMAGSLALPILHFLSRGWRWPGRVALLLVMILFALCWSSGSARQRLYMFYLGYLLIDLEIGFPKLASLGQALFTVGCVTAFLNARFLGETGLSSRVALFIEAASAAGLILGIQAWGGSLGGILDHSWAHFAGRISYSVFLVHTLIEDILIGLLWLSPLRIMTEHGLTYVFLWLGLLLSLPLVMLVAEGLYRWVEAPFIKVGKALGSARPSGSL
jgi:peptidoglycan/LPS O-acetylase OafA/YrhL